ncbi:hypothetical protein [Kiloniella sp.]|uniref:hypothetical protein n=1 Tax=Kiloniella sp. TaxID=1938587 RepID=UPI003B012781
MFKKLLLIALFTLISFRALAHVDTRIKINKNGELVGLPKQYQPAKIDRDKGAISLGKNEFLMPDCIRQYFQSPENSELEISGSWYHEFDILPPYINLNILPNDKNYEYSFLFNLNNLTIIEVLIITRPDDRSFYRHTVKFKDLCRQDFDEYYTNFH